jgi:4-hydroxy-4-methyl-2-oxoglutarate aldolase
MALTPGRHVEGPARTVALTPGDNLALHVAIAEALPGEILVALGAGGADHGIFGEILAQAAVQRGVVALVTDGRIRDRERVTALGLAVWAAGTSPRKAGKSVAGDRRPHVTSGATTVAHGDHVVADDDGVVVASRSERDAARARAARILEREAALLDGIRAGRSTLDLLDLNPTTTTGTD